MGNVIYMSEWRERLGRNPAVTSMRRSRLDRVRKQTPVAGSDLSAELRRLLSKE